MATKIRRAAPDTPTIAERRAQLHGQEEAAIRADDRAAADQARAELAQLDRLEDWEQQRGEIAKADRADAARVAAEEERAANHARALALHARRGDLAGLIEGEVATKLRPMIADLVACSRQEHDLSGSRSARATPERLAEWLIQALGLPSPWTPVHERRHMRLGQILGVEPLSTPETAPRSRPVRTPVTDDLEDD